MIASSVFPFMLAVVALSGVSGDALTARAYFDANNVRVGDPMILTIDFIGSAQFEDLHPPELSREVDQKTWKIDDTSAKTETYLNARRLVYRLRPMREGLLRFPALTFRWGDGAETATREIPVHVKPGVQAALVFDSQEQRAMPDGIVCDVAGLGEDEAFRWRKACNKPTADGFAAFDFPEARMNEAACAIVEGNWARAMRIYTSLEWRIGQTAAIERGIAAAKGELPAWRIALRPLLRYDWRGRVLAVLAALAAVSLFFFISSRLIRRLAAVALAATLALPGAAFAQAQGESPFDAIERMHEQMMQRMNNMMNGMDPFGAALGQGAAPGAFSMSFNGQQAEPPEIRASLEVSTADVRVGETFRYILSLESPRGATLDQLRFIPSEMFGMVFTGKPETLADGTCANPSNRVRRIAIPVRYDVPFKGEVSLRVDGMVSLRRQMGRSSFSFSQNFSEQTPPVPVEIKPLPTDNQPADFSGAIGTSFRLVQTADRAKVSTNDVVTVLKTLEFSGYLPLGAVPDEVERRAGNVSRVSWQDYFVADGAHAIPPPSLVWYDTQSRTYKRVVAKPIALTYVPDDEQGEAAQSVAVDAAQDVAGAKTLVLRFAPSDDAPVVERFTLVDDAAPPVETERRGDWVRLDSGSHAG
ncbi:MAG: BatD family protein, partial [Kiritimatiellae bacterium]|nr:BatD family protein [Kiritimatiellia bacterium]